MGRKFIGHEARDPHHRALRSSIGRHANASLKGEQGSDVDYLSSATLFYHPTGNRLTEEEHRALVDLNDVIPILLTGFEERRAANDSSVIDKNVDSPELTHGCFYDTRDARALK